MPSRLLQNAHDVVAVGEGAHFLPRCGDLDLVAFGVAEDEKGVGGEDAGKAFVVERELSEGGGAAVDILFAVGRVGENEIELVAGGGELDESGEDVLHADGENFRTVADALGVAADEVGVAVGFLNADGGLAAAAEGLEAEGAGAAEQLEDAGAEDAFAEAVEDGLLDAVGSGAHVEPLGHSKNLPRRAAAGDTHRGGVRAWRGWGRQ